MTNAKNPDWVTKTVNSIEYVRGWEPWSSGEWRRPMIKRSWVRLLALYTGMLFFTLICCQNCLKKTENKAGDGPFLNRIGKLLRCGHGVDWAIFKIAQFGNTGIFEIFLQRGAFDPYHFLNCCGTFENSVYF